MAIICIPVKAGSYKILKNKVREASKKADAVEIWLDAITPAIKPESILKLTKKIIVIVNKPPREKGKWQGSEEKRIERLIDYVKEGANYVDVDQGTPDKLIKRLKSVINKENTKTKLIISYHNFEKTPSLKVLETKIRYALMMGADLIKIATYTKKIEDNFILLNVLQKTNKLLNNGKRKIPLIVTGMGKYGKISRICAPFLGSAMVFTALDGKSRSAPGQLTVEEYKKIYKLINIK